MATTGTPEYLLSTHAGDICRNRNCHEAVKQNFVTGRWYITMGHPGFNSKANNAQGYHTESQARIAIKALR
jgi:hypothetical protein